MTLSSHLPSRPLARRGTSLTFNEKLKAAYLHYVRGMLQEDIAVAFEVEDARINEACVAIKAAALGPDSGPTEVEQG